MRELRSRRRRRDGAKSQLRGCACNGETARSRMRDHDGEMARSQWSDGQSRWRRRDGEMEPCDRRDQMRKSRL